jgi:hypothetical protein
MNFPGGVDQEGGGPEERPPHGAIDYDNQMQGGVPTLPPPGAAGGGVASEILKAVDAFIPGLVDTILHDDEIMDFGVDSRAKLERTISASFKSYMRDVDGYANTNSVKLFGVVGAKIVRYLNSHTLPLDEGRKTQLKDKINELVDSKAERARENYDEVMQLPSEVNPLALSTGPRSKYISTTQASLRILSRLVDLL